MFSRYVYRLVVGLKCWTCGRSLYRTGVRRERRQPPNPVSVIYIESFVSEIRCQTVAQQQALTFQWATARYSIVTDCRPWLHRLLLASPPQFVSPMSTKSELWTTNEQGGRTDACLRETVTYEVAGGGWRVGVARRGERLSVTPPPKAVVSLYNLLCIVRWMNVNKHFCRL